MPAPRFSCPRCANVIEVSEAIGWSARSRAELFGADSAPPRPQVARASARQTTRLTTSVIPSPRFSFKPVGGEDEAATEWRPWDVAPPEHQVAATPPSSLVWRRAPEPKPQAPSPQVNEAEAEPAQESEGCLEPSELQTTQGPSKWHKRILLTPRAFRYRAIDLEHGLKFGRRLLEPASSAVPASLDEPLSRYAELAATGEDDEDDVLRWGKAMLSARISASLHTPQYVPTQAEPAADSRASTLRPNQSRFPLLAHQAQFIDVDFEATAAPHTSAPEDETKAYILQEVRRIYANAPADAVLDGEKTRPFASSWRLPESAEEVIALSEDELLAVDERVGAPAEPVKASSSPGPLPRSPEDVKPPPQVPVEQSVAAEVKLPEPSQTQALIVELEPQAQDPLDEVIVKLEVDAPSPPEASPERVRRPYGRAGLWVGVFVLLSMSFVLGAVVSKRYGESAPARPVTDPVAPAAVPVRALEARHADALQFAQTTIHLAALQDTSSPRARLQIAQELLSDGRAGRAFGLLETLWAEGQRQPEVAAAYAKALWLQGRATTARQVALDGLVHNPAHQLLIDAFNEAITRDESLRSPTVTVTLESGHADKIYSLGGGKSVSLRMTRQGDSVYAFKPAQMTWREGWQAEVAAYTLCQILECGFEIPGNRMARMSQEDFYALYERVRSDKQTRYREERFGELLWVSEEDAQGRSHQYLYGTLKEWVPGFINWPIEYTEHWEPWLDVTRSLTELERVRLREALSSLRQYQGGRFYRDILRESETSGVFELGSQLSQLLAFDFVTTNWDRFSILEAYYGANNQFAQGRFISIDNGAAFHTQPMQRVSELLPKMTRFSRRQIAALRALRPGQLDLLLFPVQTEESKLRMKVFWQQRDVLLAHVDKLIQEYGAARVLGFP